MRLDTISSVSQARSVRASERTKGAGRGPRSCGFPISTLKGQEPCVLWRRAGDNAVPCSAWDGKAVGSSAAGSFSLLLPLARLRGCLRACLWIWFCLEVFVLAACGVSSRRASTMVRVLYSSRHCRCSRSFSKC